MATETIKSLRDKAEALCADGINNKEALFAALPVLTELADKVVGARKNLKAADTVAKDLSELCAKYAAAHHSIFDGGCFPPDPKGVRTGDITTENGSFHLSCGYDGYMRSGKVSTMTQEFLAGLPAEWCKSKLELSTTAINNLNVNLAELDRYGLKEKPKNVWSRVEE